MAVWLRELGSRILGGLAQLSFLVKVRWWPSDYAGYRWLSSIRKAVHLAPIGPQHRRVCSGGRCLAVCVSAVVWTRAFPLFPFLTVFPPRLPCPGCVGVLVILLSSPPLRSDAFVLLFLAASVAHMSGNEIGPHWIPSGHPKQTDAQIRTLGTLHITRNKNK